MRWRRPASHEPADGGVTLIEVTVAMTLMVVVLSMFSTAMIAVYRTISRSEAVTIAQTQVTLAFQRLDRQVRYATSISQPTTGTAGYPYVEFLTTFDGVPRCTQWRLRTHHPVLALQTRSWLRDATPDSTWTTLASNIRPVSGTVPFTRLTPDSASQFQRLQVRLEASSGGTTASKQLDMIFTALNSAGTGTDDDTCAQWRPSS